MISPQKEQAQGFILSFLSLAAWVKPTTWSGCYSLTQQIRAEIMDVILLYGYGSIPIDTFLVGWTSIYQLFWGSLGTRVLTHPHIYIYLLSFGCYNMLLSFCCFLKIPKTIIRKIWLHRGERKESSSPFTLKSHQRKRGLVLASIWLYNVV